jgi:hypothetical protein
MLATPGNLYALTLEGQAIGLDAGQSFIAPVSFKYGADVVSAKRIDDSHVVIVISWKAGAGDIAVGAQVQSQLAAQIPGSGAATITAVEQVSGVSQHGITTNQQAMYIAGAVALILTTAYLSSQVAK